MILTITHPPSAQFDLKLNKPTTKQGSNTLITFEDTVEAADVMDKIADSLLTQMPGKSHSTEFGRVISTPIGLFSFLLTT